MREFDISDAEKLYELNSDIEVVKYIGDSPYGSNNDSKEFILSYNEYKKNGFGRWAVILKIKQRVYWLV